MGQFEDLNAFATIVDAGSITKAASEMNVAKSALSRRLSLLEARYDAVLIKRDHGEWAITPHGQALYERARSIVAEVDELDHDFRQDSRSLSGPLAVTLPRDFGLSRLMPFLSNFAQKNPTIDLQMDFDDVLSDLARDNYDLAVRITPNEPDGAAEWIGQSIASFRASESYLREHGTPKCFKDLKDRSLLYYGESRRARWFNPMRQEEALEFRPRLASNTGLYLAQACAEGLGIAVLPDFTFDGHEQAASRTPVLEHLGQIILNIYVIRNPARRSNNRMRSFVDDLAEFLDR